LTYGPTTVGVDLCPTLGGRVADVCPGLWGACPFCAGVGAGGDRPLPSQGRSYYRREGKFGDFTQESIHFRAYFHDPGSNGDRQQAL